MADPIYADGFLIKEKEVNFQSGPAKIFKISINAETFTKFLEDNKNEGGWVALDLKERKTPSDKGHTHYAVLDTWKPNADGAPAGKPAGKPTKQPAPKPKASAPVDDDDIPF